MLEDQVAVVTGSARGIGRYVVHTFADAGARLAVADIEPLDNVARELREKEAEVLAVPTDVRDEDQVRALMDQVMSRYGRIDVLVNNAAVVTHFQWGNIPRWPPVRDMEKSFFDKVIGTNLGGTFLCTKHVLPYMERQRSGHIINLYGGGGPTSPGSLAYVVSKEAIRTFTRYLAEEEREHNVCVLVTSPGATIATEQAPEEARQRMPGPDAVGNRFVLAAQAGMELSGKLVTLKDGRIESAE